MPILVERSLFKIGQSLAVTLPKAWTRQSQLKAHDQVEIVVSDELIIRPKKRKRRPKKFILDRQIK